MVGWNFIFFEEILNYELSTVRIVESTVSFQEAFDPLFVEMGMCHLFFRETLNSFQNFLIGHFKDYKFCWRQSCFKYLLGILLRLIASLNHWNSHKNLSCVLIATRESIQNVPSVEAIILSQSPLVAFVE